MDGENLRDMPLSLENDQYVLKPIIDKPVVEIALSDISSASNRSSSSRKRQKVVSSNSQKDGFSKCKSNINISSTSSTKADSSTAMKKKKKKKNKKLFPCVPCGIGQMTPGDFHQHVLGKQHKKKAVPQIKERDSITVRGLNPDTTESVLYDYFSTFGVVKTIFLDSKQEPCAVIEFVQKCSVLHVIDFFSEGLGDSNLAVTSGFLVEKNQNVLLNGSTSDSQNTLSVVENAVARIQKVKCNICCVEFPVGIRRVHCLSKQHTRQAYWRIRKGRCITVKGFHHDTKVQALYDYLSRFGRVLTIVEFREKELCAAVEFLRKCSVDHVVNSFVPHVLENCQLVASAGLPFGNNLGNMPAYLQEGLGSLKNLCSEPDKKNAAAADEKATKREMNSSAGKGKGKGQKSTLFQCSACSVTITPGERRNHYLSKNHIKKALNHMRESSCVTVAGCPGTITKEELYDYFTFYEHVRTVDMRRLMEGLAVVEFEDEYPLRGVVDCVNSLVIGTTPVTVIRGCPALHMEEKSTVSHDKKCSQQEQKSVDSRDGSQIKSSASRTLDSLIKNEFENAMKALQTQTSRTFTENPEACNATGFTSSDEIMSKSFAPNDEISKRSATNDEIISKSSVPNNETKEEPVRKPFMCDVCNLFCKPEDVRMHHLGKKHNENAKKYLNAGCTLTVWGFPKDCKAEHLYDYFSLFGKVKTVIISKKKGKGALVGFYSEKCARKIKSKDVHIFKGGQLVFERGNASLHGRGKPLESQPAYDDLMSSLQKLKTVECQILRLQSALILSKDNMRARIDLCNQVKGILTAFFPRCVLHLFGSSVNSFGLKGSDVDILFEADPCVTGVVGSEEGVGKHDKKTPNVAQVLEGRFHIQSLSTLPKLSQLDFIKKVLRKHERDFYAVVFVSAAACPIVKFISKNYGLSCDLSNGNRLSLCNTGLLQTFGRLDKRVIPLVTALRYWAKKFNYISTNNFSSYAFTLMVIFFLQTREPCILPSVEYLRACTDKKMEVAGFDCSFCSDVNVIGPSTNCEKIENLLLEFFNYYGKLFDYDKYVISPLTGCCELVELFKSDPSSSQNFKVSAVCIQDPFLLSRNVSSFVKEGSLKRMTEQMRKITREQYAFLQKQKSQTDSSQSAIWGIPQLFEIMPKHIKVPKKIQGANPFTMVKIPLGEDIVNAIKQKYGIHCTQCVNLSEIAIHEVCRIVIKLMHAFLYDTEIIVDKRNHCELALKLEAKDLSFSCTCAESHSTADDIHSEKSDEDLLEVSDSPSTDASISGEEPEQNCLAVDERSCASDSTSQESDAGQFSDEEDNKMVDANVLDTQGSASTKVPVRFDVTEHKEFLSLWFATNWQTWVCRKIYKKQCTSEGDAFEIEKRISQKISQVESLKLENPAKFKGEFYEFYANVQPIVYLKVIPPDQKRFWKSATSFWKQSLPRMVQSLIRE